MLLWGLFFMSIFFSVFSIMTLRWHNIFSMSSRRATDLIIHLLNILRYLWSDSFCVLWAVKRWSVSFFLLLSVSLSLFLEVGFSWDWKWVPTLKNACQREAAKQWKRSNCFCVSPQWLKGRNILSLLWHESSKASAEEKKNHLCQDTHRAVRTRALQCVINWPFLTGLNTFHNICTKSEMADYFSLFYPSICKSN